MNEVKCPHCHTVFTIDEAEYAAIVQQVRTAEFERELHTRLAEAEKAKQTEIALAVSKAEQDAQKAAADKDAEIGRLKAEAKAAKTEQQLAVTEAVAKVEKRLTDAETKLALAASEQKLQEASLKENHGTELALVNESHTKEVTLLNGEIDRLKDYKAKLSVKMLGETLEQHCEIEFERARPMAFPNAEFGKDNDASGGTKGDYVFRDFSDGRVEFVSIMFEMKNEADESTNKKKNADHFAKLDKDRNDKDCEYAVLVSMLEADSEIYTGITPVHAYDKMFVVRPQFFLGIIALLRNAARETIQVKAELELTKQQNIDITNFEDKLLGIQTSFGNSLEQAGKQYDKAVKQIDDTIKGLEGLKESLRLWLKHLGTANGKVEGLSVKQLTRGNDTMKAKFTEIEASKDPEAGLLHE